MSDKIYREYDQCPICGDPLLIDKKNSEKLKCECCGFTVSVNVQITEEDHERLKQANDCLRSYEFDRAEDRYNLILEDNSPDSEVYLTALFGKLLSSFGVVYIKDFNGEAIPTFCEYDPDVKSIKESSIYKQIVDLNISKSSKKPYLDLIDNLDKVYKRIDKEINQKSIYDYFICTKISRKTTNNPDADGLTVDSSHASRFYDFLVKNGYRVFYSDKCCNEIEYDSQILSALLKSEKMLVIATQEDYLKSSWVESEWRRWINFVNCGKKTKDSLILCFPTYNLRKFDLPRALRKTQRYTSEIEALNALTVKKEEPVLKTVKVIEEVKAVEKIVKNRTERSKSKEELYMLAEKYYDGDGVEKNLELALKYYTLAAEMGDFDAQFSLGLMYGVGEGCKVDLVKSFTYHKLAADQGHIYAQFEVGQCYKNGWGCEESIDLAIKYFDLSAKQGYDEAKKILTQLKKQTQDEKKVQAKVEKESVTTKKEETKKPLPKANDNKKIEDDSALSAEELFSKAEGYYSGRKGFSKDLKKAFDYYLLAANKGHCNAQLKVAQCYETGVGCDKNQEEALKYYHLAAKNGSNEASEKIEIYELDKMDLEEIYQRACNYAEGKNGYKYSTYEAYKLYKFAAEKGHAQSQYAVGKCEENGTNYALKSNLKAAFKYYKLSADQSCKEAQYALGCIYQNPMFYEGVKQDYDKAFKYYKSSADQGYEPALEELMECYRNGYGCEKNLYKALEILEKLPEKNSEWKDNIINGIIRYIRFDRNVSSDELFTVLEKYDKYFSSDDKFKTYEELALKGHPGANFYVANKYANGIDCVKDDKKAVLYYTRAANKGHLDAQLEIARRYLIGRGCAEDFKKALTFFEMAAEQNDISAQRMIGDAYGSGAGGEIDFDKSFKYTKLAADQGDKYSQHMTGYHYKCGIGCEENLEKALEYFILAANNKDEESQNEVVEFYRSGKGVEKDLVKAFELDMLYASQDNNSNSQNNLGDCYRYGWGCEVNLQEAFKWYKLSAENNNEKGLYDLGCCYKEKIGCELDLTKAYNCYEKSALKGHTEAQYEMAQAYHNGILHYPKDLNKALEFYKKAADNGHVISQYQTGLLEKDLKMNDEEAFNYFKKAAKNGHAESQRYVGTYYERGIGSGLGSVVNIDNELAFKYYQMAVKGGDVDSLMYLGNCYELGIGCEKDLEKSLECYEDAVYFGINNRHAYYKLGKYYQNGLGGCQINLEEAYKYYIKAANLGDDLSQLYLGVFYEEGKICDKDYEEAYKYFKLAADQGNRMAQYRLGLLLEEGRGCTKNKKEAIACYKKAAKAGLEEAKNKLKKMWIFKY